jgi:hypothetical protein
MLPSRAAFIRYWLLPACLVVVVRLVHGTNLGYDPSIQLQAAENLLNGRGLIVYSADGGADLASPIKPQVLTYFPAGYSACAALLMAFGCSTAVAVKILGAFATILGWWGWGRLAYAFMRNDLEKSVVWRWIAIAIALITPILGTPPWAGTDIFLWAALPWVLEFVTRAVVSDPRRQIRFDFIAGVISGFSVLLRYEALLLVAYGGLVILCQSIGRASVLWRRILAYGVGLGPFIATQIFINDFASNGPFVAGGLRLHPQSGSLIDTVRMAFLFLTTANYPLVWWLPRRGVQFFTQSGQNAPWLLALTLLALVSIPLALAIKIGYRNISKAMSDIRCAAAGLILAFPLFLWGCAFGGAVYVVVTRYYLPLIPLAVFCAYLFAVRVSNRGGLVGKTVRLIAIGYGLAYFAMTLIGIGLLFVPGGRASDRRLALLGNEQGGPWFSSRPSYTYAPSRQYFVRLLEEHPGTILVTNREHWFYADPHIDQARLHRLEGLRANYITGPAHIVILAADPFPAPDTALYWFRSYGKPIPAPYFDSVPDLHLIRRFPEENIKVLEANVPAGVRIDLKRAAET